MNELTDGSVTLRPLKTTDAKRMAELSNNRKISINLRDAFPVPYLYEHAESFIEVCLHQNPQQVFAIEYNGEYAGNIALIKESDVYHHSAEIGYFLGEPYWNKGIMTKAVRLICAYGFKNLDIVRIHTGVFDYNLASQRVLEKCGFVKEGVFKNAVCKEGKIFNEIRYATFINGQ